MKQEIVGNYTAPLWFGAPKESYEEQYMSIVQETFEYGIREENSRTGEVTHRLPHREIKVAVCRDGIPYLQSKQSDFGWPIREIMWIMQQQSSNTDDLGIDIWDKWTDPVTHEIGCAYGAIVKMYKQMDTLIDKIKNDPTDRGMVINLWDCRNLDKMNLRPCCYASTWSVINGYLNCHLTQRSADLMVGVPYNSVQYCALMIFLAKVCGLKPGLFTQTLVDAHIYDCQFENTRVQIDRWSVIQGIKEGTLKDLTKSELDIIKCQDMTFEEIKEVINTKPVVYLNSELNDFYKINDKVDIRRDNYKSLGKLNFKVVK